MCEEDLQRTSEPSYAVTRPGDLIARSSVFTPASLFTIFSEGGRRAGPLAGVAAPPGCASAVPGQRLAGATVETTALVLAVTAPFTVRAGCGESEYTGC